MKRIFISQPMKGLTDEEILVVRKETEDKVKELFSDEKYLICDSFS